MAVSDSLEIPKKLDRYTIKQRLGVGGTSSVYEAWDEELRRAVALKFFVGVDVRNDSQRSRIEEEARNQAALSHPNIVEIFQYGFTDHGPYTVMELIRGETLQQLRERTTVSLADFLDIAQQTLSALKEAHKQGMLHLDLKAPNVMVTRRTGGGLQVKLLDFGLSKKMQGARFQETDREGGLMGSIHTMAPEQFEQQRIDERTDLYALGCIFYFLLTGFYPFHGDSDEEIMQAHLAHRYVDLNVARRDLPPALGRWVMNLMALKRTDRPVSATAALNELEALAKTIRTTLEDESVAFRPSKPESADDEEKATGRKAWVIPVFSVGLSMVTAVLAWIFVPGLIERFRGAEGESEGSQYVPSLIGATEEEDQPDPALAERGQNILQNGDASNLLRPMSQEEFRALPREERRAIVEERRRIREARQAEIDGAAEVDPYDLAALAAADGEWVKLTGKVAAVDTQRIIVETKTGEQRAISQRQILFGPDAASAAYVLLQGPVLKEDGELEALVDQQISVTGRLVLRAGEAFVVLNRPEDLEVIKG